MKFGKIKKLITCIALSATVACMAATAAGCSAETDHPEVSITYEFNGKEYVIEYTLYRNMYPNTVRHFIELTENGFYNNTVVHDMKSNDWFGGAYSYDEEAYKSRVDNEDTGAMSDYYSLYNAETDTYISKEYEYYDLFNAGKFTPSVYSGISYEGQKQVLNKDFALPNLYGEFSENGHTVKKGALPAEYGSLKMYYSEKETTQHVYITTPATGSTPYERQYKYNCATYVFGMQVGTTSTYVASKYCVFASVKDSSKVDTLVKAVTDYNNSTYGTATSTHYIQTTVEVDQLENFSTELNDKSTEETFNSPKTAIVIKSVKVTSY